jgi:serine/threonine-protein kinase HipA
MAVRGTSKHYRVSEIERRHFNMTAEQCGHGQDMEAIIDDVIARTPEVVESVGASLPKGFPEEVFASVTGGLMKSATRIGRMAVR